MLIIILIFTVILSFVTTFYLSNKTLSNILPLILMLAATITGSLLLMNDTTHFGMHKQTISHTKQIYSVAGNQLKAGILLKQPVGSNGKEFVVVYSHRLDPKKLITSKPALKQEQNIIFANSDIATLRTTKTYWRYNTKTTKFWFAFLGNNHSLIQTKKEYTLPANRWLVSDSEKFSKLQKHQSAFLSNQNNLQSMSAENQVHMLEDALNKIK